MLPTDGTTAVDSVGPTFWIGGTVTDPDSAFNEAFLELQLYPNSMLAGCSGGGGFNVRYAPGIWTALSGVAGVEDRQLGVGGVQRDADRLGDRWAARHARR